MLLNKNFNLVFIALFLLSFGKLNGQTYTSYFTGNQKDSLAIPSGGICLMGGSTENDEAMKWFLRRANGGDVLVLRASGGNGYNNYFFSELGVKVNSVETIVVNSKTASNETYIQQKIKNAEAIWFAGGDQWKYISYWRNTAMQTLINKAITDKHTVIGGTSAGMAILGNFYYSAQNGGVLSETALANPYDIDVTVDTTSFINNKYLKNTITDTHYDNPDRKGRHTVFLARLLKDYGIFAYGIACDESTAVCINENGTAQVFGKFPASDDNAYFIQSNCELPTNTPENCTRNSLLTWNLNAKALTVYQVKGTNTGTNTFSLADWKTGTGGTWRYWYINAGNLYETLGNQISCKPLQINKISELTNLEILPNPANDLLTIFSEDAIINDVSILNIEGKTLQTSRKLNANQTVLEISTLKAGLYFVIIQVNNSLICRKFVKN